MYTDSADARADVYGYESEAASAQGAEASALYYYDATEH